MDINWYPGHMAKTKRLISENIKVIDLVFELIDARIPYSSKIRDIDPMLKDKPRILIFNKWDLADQKQTNKWQKYYEAKGYKTVATDLINKTHIKELLNLSDQIAKEVNAKRKLKGMKPRELRILVVGIPNVGKSTLINTLVKKKAAIAANKPGVTRGLSWIRVKDGLELLDTPGILWPKFESQEVGLKLASLTAIKEEILSIQDLALFIVKTMHDLYPGQIEKRYNLESIDFEDIENTIEEIGRNRKLLMQGNKVSHEHVYRLIVTDLKNGNFGPVTFDRYGETDVTL